MSETIVLQNRVNILTKTQSKIYEVITIIVISAIFTVAIYVRNLTRIEQSNLSQPKA